MPHFKTIAEFEAQTGADAPTTAETELIAACKAGKVCVLSDSRPEFSTEANTIRADLLRLLIIGGGPDCGLHETGVELIGAWITGPLTLDFATARGITLLDDCHFTDEPQMMQAQLRFLSLEGSHLPGLRAQGLVVDGDVVLSSLTATKTVSLNGARIAGQLNCEMAKLDGQTGPDTWGDALNAQGIWVEADMFLSEISANGPVDLAGAQIVGQLAFVDARLNGQTGKTAWGTALIAQQASVGASCHLNNLAASGEVDLNGAQVVGQLTCKGAHFDGKGRKALNAQSLKVGQSFLWRDIRQCLGRVDLAGAQVGDLVDDLKSWPADLVLDGFTYDRISGSPTDARGRMPWLAKGSTFKGIFYPQPYTQLAKVLFAMGHDREARKVLMERERLLAEANAKSLRAEYDRARSGGPGQNGDVGRLWFSLQGTRLWSGLMRWVAGYGYAPQRALLWSLGFIFLAMVIDFFAYRQGVIVALNPETTASPSFFALPYAADIYLPGVDLGQDSSWGPAATVGGDVLRWFNWLWQAAGFVVAGLGLAAITGLIQRDRE